jgi:hypothetical protein
MISSSLKFWVCGDSGTKSVVASGVVVSLLLRVRVVLATKEKRVLSKEENLPKHV